MPLNQADALTTEPDVAIRISDLHKHYPVFSSVRDRLRYLNATIFGQREKALENATVVRAVNGLSLTIKRGERVGIIGRNGAGKSTLLKLLAGGFEPTMGTIEVNGEVYSLMPGNISFTPDLSAHDNIGIYLLQFGFAPDVIAQKTKEVEEFVELGEYFHQPIKNYSLGMRVRTEFATATCLDAEILVIDEVLGAGDVYWTAKCAMRMEQLCRQGRTLLFVSHALDQVMKFCERCIWIDQGDVIMEGSSFEVSRRYEGFLERLSWHTGDVDDKQVSLHEVVPNLGDIVMPSSGQQMVRWPGLGKIKFSGIWLNDAAVTEISLSQDEELRLRLELMPEFDGPISLRVLVTFWGEDGKRVAIIENDSLDVTAKCETAVEFTVAMQLAQLGVGNYTMSLSLFSLSASKETADEGSSRQDVLYKSVAIEISAANDKDRLETVPYKFSPQLSAGATKGGS